MTILRTALICASGLVLGLSSAALAQDSEFKSVGRGAPVLTTSAPISRGRSTPRCPGNQLCSGLSKDRSTVPARGSPDAGLT